MFRNGSSDNLSQRKRTGFSVVVEERLKVETKKRVFNPNQDNIAPSLNSEVYTQYTSKKFNEYNSFPKPKKMFSKSNKTSFVFNF